MNDPEREGLVGRIRQMRRQSAAAATGPETPVDVARLEALHTRLAHLEGMVQGLQDSVYRESQRQDKRLADLEAQIEPAALAAELSKHAREHGL
jgi:hypothetical protein